MADAKQADFLFCTVCRVHHQSGKKHKYSMHHKKFCKEVISKYKHKIKQCFKYLDKPEVINGELEPGASFWCQFCEERIPKHVTDRTISIRYGGLFEHLSSSEHHKKTHKFWKVNGGDKKEKDDFFLTSDVYSRFKRKCQECLEDWNKQQEVNRLKIAEDIKKAEYQRAEFVAVQHQQNVNRIFEVRTVNNSYGVLQNPTGWHNGIRVWRGGIVRTGQQQNPLQTNTKVRSNKSSTQTTEHELQNYQKLPTLSRVARTAKTSNKGNVHTGAIPPWLQNDDSDAETNSVEVSQPIGPSFEEFKKYAEKTKKKKTNPKRVGANFDRDKKKDDNWLPSFGGVWNSGPRWHSRREFKAKHTHKAQT